MHDYFGKDIKNVNVAKFEDVIETVKRGKADYGVLPIENSSAGFVSGIYDMVGSSGLTIVGGDEVKVAHMLMGVRAQSFLIYRLYIPIRRASAVQ